MKEQLEKINKKWKLPSKYIDYLKSIPLSGKDIENEEYGLHLYGINELIKNQEGYSYNPIEKKIIEDWPESYVVIGDSNADPFVLDLSKSDGVDAPVLFAEHGMGEWDFQVFAKSISDFLGK